MSALVELGLGLLVACWFAGILVLALVIATLRELGASSTVSRTVFVFAGAIILSPALLPVSITVATPVPLGALLLFVRSGSDLAFLVHMWPFLAPSLLLTSAACWLVAMRLFPNYSLKRTAAG